MLRLDGGAGSATVRPIPSGGVLVLGVPFPSLELAEGACLEVLGQSSSVVARMRLVEALVAIRAWQRSPRPLEMTL